MNLQELQKTFAQNPEIVQEFAAEIQRMQKAAVDNSTYTFSPSTRSIFVGENLDPIIKTLVPTATPIRNLIPRKAGSGQATAWKKLTSALHPGALGTGANPGGLTGTGTSVGFADAGSPNETTQTYAVTTAAYKLLGRKIELGLQHIAASKDHLPAEEAQLRIKTLEVMQGEEDMIINGNSAIDSNAFDGLLKQITTNSGTASLLTASGVGIFDQTLFDQGESGDTLLVSPRQARALSDELQGSGSIQRITVGDQGGAVANLKVSKIISPSSGKEIDIVVSRYMGEWAILGAFRSPAGQNWIEMEDLIPMIAMDVPSTNFSKTKFVVESTVLKLIGEPFFFKIGGLAT